MRAPGLARGDVADVHMDPGAGTSKPNKFGFPSIATPARRVALCRLAADTVTFAGGRPLGAVFTRVHTRTLSAQRTVSK